jgi:hypothetical protein
VNRPYVVKLGDRPAWDWSWGCWDCDTRYDGIPMWRIAVSEALWHAEHAHG